MKVSALIPSRVTERDTWRGTLQQWVCQRLMESGLVDEIILADSDANEPFNRAAARNHAAKKATGDIFVVCDADTFTRYEFLANAIENVRYHGTWAFPYGRYYNLTKMATIERLWSTSSYVARPTIEDIEHDLESSGGMYVMSREAWDAVGGYPTAFRGWGYEDNCFALAAETFLGKPVRNRDGFVCHLWHHAPESVRFDQPQIEYNRRIFHKFEDALGEKKLMRMLCQKYR